MAETKDLAEFIERVEFDDVPAEVREKSKEAIADFVGVAVYGSKHGVGERISAYTTEAAPGDEATVFARGSASAPGAALANATFGHAIDYDDTFESIVIHPTAPVFSAALASGERIGTTGEELLTAYVVGVEAAFRIGHSTYPSHYDNGWHSTGTICPFGAAAAAASVMGLSTDEIRNAFGIAASSSSSLKKNFGTMTKPLHSGHAAQMGVRAALLAANEFTADSNILEGDLGYGEVMTPYGEYEPNEVNGELGETWAVMDIGYKPYPSGVITHAAMDALREIIVDNDLDPKEVERVTVALDDAASEMLHHESPETELEAKFSIEFCLAAVLLERDPGIYEFTDKYVTATETYEQMLKVERAFEPNLFGGDFANYAARVTVDTVSGEVLVNEMKHAPGSPNNPLSESRLQAKFDECSRDVLPAADADTAYAAIRNLETSGSLDRLIEAVR